jgi:hypothetical protein
MERVIGVGGSFFRAGDPQALARWYEANLGIPVFPEATYGRFCWATDPEGNRFELWEPSPDIQAAE